MGRRTFGPSAAGYRSDAFLLELEGLLVVLLGELQPDEQPGQHDQRAG